MTPEQAAENAAAILDKAASMHAFPEEAAALVQVADGWTRLHTALANAPESSQVTVNMPAAIQDADPEKIAQDVAREVNRRWGLHERVPALTLAFDPAQSPIVRAGGVDHEIVGWNVNVGQDDGVGHITLQVVKLGRKR